MTQWASSGAVEQAINQWQDGVVECRTYGHGWRSATVLHRPGIYTIIQRCSRCTTERERDMTERGDVLGSWHMHYPRGYLLVGLGRIGAENRGLLRLASLRGLRIEEVNDDD